MFEITKDFTGGNIEVISATNNEVKLQRELRDTSDEWFYWAFCVKGAQGKTVKFDIGDDYLGPFGPAVSHDLENWQWLNKRDSDRCFTVYILRIICFITRKDSRILPKSII